MVTLLLKLMTNSFNYIHFNQHTIAGVLLKLLKYLTLSKNALIILTHGLLKLVTNLLLLTDLNSPNNESHRLQFVIVFISILKFANFVTASIVIFIDCLLSIL